MDFYEIFMIKIYLRTLDKAIKIAAIYYSGNWLKIKNKNLGKCPKGHP